MNNEFDNSGKRLKNIIDNNQYSVIINDSKPGIIKLINYAYSQPGHQV